VAFLFDTNAIAEVLRKRPNRRFLTWLTTVPPDQQHTSILVVAECFAGAFRSSSAERWLQRYEQEIFPLFTIVRFDLECALRYGRLKGALLRSGQPGGDVDMMLAATAQAYGLTLVTANERHFRAIPGLPLVVFEPAEDGALVLP